jgi:hypothetical protein
MMPGDAAAGEQHVVAEQVAVDRAFGSLSLPMPDWCLSSAASSAFCASSRNGRTARAAWRHHAGRAGCRGGPR